MVGPKFSEPTGENSKGQGSEREVENPRDLLAALGQMTVRTRSKEQIKKEKQRPHIEESERF